jgi:hypothetical protein
MIMEYRTQKILLTGNIDDESHPYLQWCCDHSNSLDNCNLFALRPTPHFGQYELRFFLNQNDCDRSSLNLSKLEAGYGKLYKSLKDNKS